MDQDEPMTMVRPERRLEEPWRNENKDYREVEMIGKGAYGAVFLVRHRLTNEEYALKKIIVKLSEEGIPQSVIREISTLKQISNQTHPNIIKLHDIFHGMLNDTEMYLNVVYEKCDWDLYEFLRLIPRDMPDVQVRHLSRQLFRGIDFLHVRGVIHRDLKPQNILVNRDQSLKIADFGLARFYSMQSSFTTVVVTLWYRAPELLLQCPYSTAVDIWSAGCILAELYAREALFPGQTEAEQISIIFQKLGTPSTFMWPADSVVDRSFYPSYPGIALERLMPKMPADGRQLIKSLLAFSPSQRMTAAQALKSIYFSNGSPLN